MILLLLERKFEIVKVCFLFVWLGTTAEGGSGRGMGYGLCDFFSIGSLVFIALREREIRKTVVTKTKDFFVVLMERRTQALPLFKVTLKQ